VSSALSVALTYTPVTELNLKIPHSFIEQIAGSIAERAFDLFAERMASGTPWMTTDEAIAYTRIPAGTFDKLAARGRIPSHSADGGRRKLYHREELDRYLGYARPHRPIHRWRHLLCDRYAAWPTPATMEEPQQGQPEPCSRPTRRLRG
jgi:excisionase family DNA binding protein